MDYWKLSSDLYTCAVVYAVAHVHLHAYVICTHHRHINKNKYKNGGPRRFFFLKDFMSETRQMAQQLGTLPAFVEGLSLVPITHLTVHNHLSLQLQEI